MNAVAMFIAIFRDDISAAILFWLFPTFGDFTKRLLIGLKGLLINVE